MTIIYFLIVIGILVFVHELGHFLMAKKAGVRVEKFSLGMGPKIVGYKKGDTEYIISALPLGGYVKMAGENPDEEPTGAEDEFQSKSVWQRAQIAAAGSLTNILLAFIIMPLVFMLGTYVGDVARIGYVVKGSPGDQAGFTTGDIIEQIGWRNISSWRRAELLILANPETDLKVTIDRQGKKKTLTLRPKLDAEKQYGVSGLVPDLSAEIGGVRPGFPAEKEGFKAKDKIIAVNGTAVNNWFEFSTLVKKSGGKELMLTIERNGERLDKSVTPIKSDAMYVIGVEPPLELEFRRYGFFESMKRGFHETLWVVDLTFLTLKKLLTFKISIKSLGGPVRIAQFSGQAARVGVSAFIGFLAIISISLGILNLMPIPVLDGGMLLFLLIEAIRKKPLSRKVMEVAQTVGAALLILLIVVVTYNDIMRIVFK